jgi:hypothetical protein
VISGITQMRSLQPWGVLQRWKLLRSCSWQTYIHWFLNCFVNLHIDNVAFVLSILFFVTSSFFEGTFGIQMHLHWFDLVDQGLKFGFHERLGFTKINLEIIWLQECVRWFEVWKTFVGYWTFNCCKLLMCVNWLPSSWLPKSGFSFIVRNRSDHSSNRRVSLSLKSTLRAFILHLSKSLHVVFN